jgi:hypothetical protein
MQVKKTCVYNLCKGKKKEKKKRKENKKKIILLNRGKEVGRKGEREGSSIFFMINCICRFVLSVCFCGFL